MHPPISAGADRPFGITAAECCPAQRWFDIMFSDIGPPDNRDHHHLKRQSARMRRR